MALSTDRPLMRIMVVAVSGAQHVFIHFLTNLYNVGMTETHI